MQLKFLGNNKKPFVYWFFWILLVAVCLGLVVFAWYNIQPYQNAAMAIFKIPRNEPSKFFDILWFRFNLSTSWVIGAIAWGILQGFQVNYLLITQSEKALDFLIRQSNTKGSYALKEQDDKELKFAKKQYNRLPLSTLTFLRVARTVCYTIELFVSLYSYPWINGSWWDFVVSVSTGRFDRLNYNNIVMALLLMFAVESLVFAAIMIYRVIEVFNKSGAYKKNNSANNWNS
ncbi:MAG: hypothetical protein KME29_31665 [Calothrix sp. FI2-JRJ7]|nr:hypothetical protein [Calothrix sp. FI2-JRJ7]